MAYLLEVHRKAGKFIGDLEPDRRQRVWEAINALKTDPRPPGCLKLTDFKPHGWRIRIGKLRVLYRIDDTSQSIRVFHVDSREDAYRKSR
jgi:mRNA interferase RelE/StbE